jgi:hypothetical protein
MCCDWFYESKSEPYDEIILHSGSARSMSKFFKYGIQACIADTTIGRYGKYLDYNPNLKGTVVIKFTIGSEGSIVNDTILSSTTKNRKFDKYIKDGLHKCKWDEIDSGTSTVTFPFTFWKSKDDYHRSKKQKKIQSSSLNPGDESYTTYWMGAMNAVTVETDSITLDISVDNARSRQNFEKICYFGLIGLEVLYDDCLKLKPDCGGKVKLKLTISPSGDVIDSSIMSSTMGDINFDIAVQAKIVSECKWKSVKGGNTTVTIPLIFTPYKL